MVKSCVKSGNWSQSEAAISHLHIKDELCIYRELLLRVIRIVIPDILRDRVLKITRDGHQGIAETKTTLLSKV